MLRVFFVIALFFWVNISVAKDKLEQYLEEEVLSVTSENSLDIATWIDISPQSSQLSLLDGEENVVFRKAFVALDNLDIYAESLIFPNGSILLKRDKNYAVIPEMEDLEVGKNELIKKEMKRLLGELKQKVKGLKESENIDYMIPEIDDTGSAIIDKDGGILDKNRKTYLISATIESDAKHCMWFYKILADKSLLAQRAIGVFCSPKKQGNINKEEDENLLAMAENLNFDGGVYNQAYTLSDVSKELHDYSSSLDGKAPEVTISKGFFNKNSLFVSGFIKDESDISFIKINGQRLKKSDFSRVLSTSEGENSSFSIYIKSAEEINQGKITVGDKYGNSQTKEINSGSGSIPSGISPIEFKSVVKNTTYALLAAVDDYKLSELKPLTSPQYDVKLIKDTLTSVVGIPDKQVFVLDNPTKIEFMDKLEEIREKKLAYGDRLIIYFSGHGNNFGDENMGYWAFSDTTRLPESWLSNLEFKNFLGGFSDGGILLISDSCFSGGFLAKDFSDDPKSIKYEYPKQARTVLTSGSDAPVPDVGDKFNSAFAKAISNGFSVGIEKMKKFKGFDGEIPVYMIYDAVKKELAAKKQRPYYGSFYQTDDLLKDFILKLEN